MLRDAVGGTCKMVPNFRPASPPLLPHVMIWAPMSENTPPPLLQMERVSVLFPGAPPALTDVSFEVSKGEALGLLGPSGAGKTTLLKVLAGLLFPVAGRVRFDGVEFRRSSIKRGLGRTPLSQRLGMTFQNSGLFDSLTCGENLTLALRECGVDKSEWAERVYSALSDVGLAGSEKLYPHEISGGMRKRLGIARALLMRPEVVLYDDPTAGLDPVTSRSIVDLIATTRERRAMTFVLVTSDLAQAMRLCDRLAFLYQGKLLTIGGASEVKASLDPVVHQFMNGLLRGPLTDESRTLYDRI